MIIDIIAAILIAVGFYAGYSRGIINTVFDTLSILLAIIFTLKLSPFVISLCKSIIPVGNAINFIIGFVLTFLAVMYIVRLIGKQLESLLKVIHLNFVNKIAGGVLMSVFYAFCFSLVLWVVNNGKLISEEQKEKSVAYAMLEPLPKQGQVLFAKFKPLFTDFWGQVVNMADDIKEQTDDLDLGKSDTPSNNEN